MYNISFETVKDFVVFVKKTGYEPALVYDTLLKEIQPYIVVEDKLIHIQLVLEPIECVYKIVGYKPKYTISKDIDRSKLYHFNIWETLVFEPKFPENLEDRVFFLPKRN